MRITGASQFYPLLLLAIVAAALNFIMISPNLGATHLFADQEVFIYQAREIVAGRMPYRDIFSHHFLGYVLPLSIFQLFANLTPDRYLIVVALWYVLPAFFIYLIFCEAKAPRLSAFVAALVPVTVGWLAGFYGPQCNKQMLLLPLVYCMVYYLVKVRREGKERHFLILCLVFAISVSFDQRLVFFCFIPLHALFSLRHIISTGLIVRSFMVAGLPWVLMFLWLWHSQALSAFLFQTVIYPFSHRGSHLDPVSVNWTLASLYERETALATLSVVGVWLSFKLRDQRSGMVHVRALTPSILACLWIGGLLAKHAGGFDFKNYYLFLSPAIVCSVCVLLTVVLQHAWVHKIVHIGVLLFCLVYVLGSVTDSLRRLELRLPHTALDRTVALLTELKKEKGRTSLFVFGFAPQIYNRLGEFSQFNDIGLLSITGANFFSQNSEEQGYVLSQVQMLEFYLRNEPPDIFVRFDPKRVSGHILVPAVHAIFDYDKLVHLRFIPHILVADYTLEARIEGPTAVSEVYVRK